MPILKVLLLLPMLNSATPSCERQHRSNGSPYDVISFFSDPLTSCGCNATLCLRKCCADGYLMEKNSCVPKQRAFAPAVYNRDVRSGSSYSLISGLMPCAERSGYFRLDPRLFPEDRFLVQADGRLWQPSLEVYTDTDRYCMEEFDDIGTSALVCFPQSVRIGRKLNALGMIISMPFLLITFLAYAALPDKNLHGKSLMCYVLSLFAAYLFLVVVQMHSASLNDAACHTLGTFCLFFFVVSFVWTNVMSVDIWWTFSGLRGFSGSKKERERKRFLLYSGYAWGLPLLLVAVVTLLNSVGDVGTWYFPGIGDGQCWLREGLPTLLYFYLPMAALIAVNVVLFAKTARTIRRLQRDTAILRKEDSKRHYENDQQRFYLYLKLLLAMGVNWSMEIISWAVMWQAGSVPAAVWYLTDFCNAIYGVFIFFIFVFKKNVRNQLTKRYYMVLGRAHLARSVTASPRTTETAIT